MNTPILSGNFYHIYNRGNNKEDLFIREEHYEKFLYYYRIFICPIADTYAWCLLRNHFHFLIRIKEDHEMGFFDANASREKDLEKKWKVYKNDTKELIKKKYPIPVSQFKHMFASYSKWINTNNKRTGSLFEKNFERRMIESDEEIINLIAYINNNPVKHGFVKLPQDYKWSSFNEVLKNKSDILHFEFIWALFPDRNIFINEHIQRIPLTREEKNDGKE
jgi:REP element-mobilizing transposase RayT